MTIDFIGHAGFAITKDGVQILVDPWLTPSTFEKPIISGMFSKHQSIDYLIPEPIHRHDSFNPDIILLSHHHGHHSSAHDITYWLDNSQKQITVISPDIDSGYQNTSFATTLRNYENRHRFLFIPKDEEIYFEPFHIRTLSHTVPHHFGFFIKSPDGSFLHLADAKANRLAWDRRLDPIWMKFLDLSPSFLALTGGSLSSRLGADQERHIVENVFMSPVEAANLSAAIRPLAVGLMGFFNFSVWKNRHEYGFSAVENESYFNWALTHLNPSIRNILCRPGLRLELEDGKIASRIV